MLKNTFLHIPGIGAVTEQRLWNSGITDWDTPFDNTPVPISPSRKMSIINGIEESINHLEIDNPAYFSNQLPANLSWRLFPEFRKSTVYLDIETTGLERDYCDITTIALYDGEIIQTYVHGQNLNDFIDDIQKYNVIVSYNGKSFDVPFIENYFGIQLNHAQIDLRYVLSSLGYKGGLKRCERQLGMDRGDLSDIDGFFAVLLWNEYKKKENQKVLDTLLAYNVQDKRKGCCDTIIGIHQQALLILIHVMVVRNIVEKPVQKKRLQRMLFQWLKPDWSLFQEELDVTAGLPVLFSWIKMIKILEPMKMKP